jgi:hypothetical protein
MSFDDEVSWTRVQFPAPTPICESLMIKLISDEFDDLPALTPKEINQEIDAMKAFVADSIYIIQIDEWVKPLIDWFWLERIRILKDVSDNIKLVGDYYGFQVYYPEYGGMPKFISNQLNDLHLDLINKYIVSILTDYPKEKDFKKKFLSILTNSTIKLS